MRSETVYTSVKSNHTLVRTLFGGALGMKVRFAGQASRGEGPERADCGHVTESRKPAMSLRAGSGLCSAWVGHEAAFQEKHSDRLLGAHNAGRVDGPLPVQRLPQAIWFPGERQLVG